MQTEELAALLENLEKHGIFPVLSEPAQTAFIQTLKNFGWKCNKNANEEWEIAQKPSSSPKPQLDQLGTFQEKYDEALAPEVQLQPGNMSARPDPENFAALHFINLQAMLRPDPKTVLAPTSAPALLLSEDAARVLKITLQNNDLRNNISKLAQQDTVTNLNSDNFQKHLKKMTDSEQNAFVRYFNLQTNGVQLQTPQQNQVQARVQAIQKATSIVMGLPPEQKESVKQSLIESLSRQESSSKLGAELMSSFSTRQKPYPY